MLIRLAIMAQSAELVSPRTSKRSGLILAKTASQLPSKSARSARLTVSPNTPRKLLGFLIPNSSKKTSLRLWSKFWPVCTNTCSANLSSFSIIRESRIISGRVPRTVTIFTLTTRFGLTDALREPLSSADIRRSLTASNGMISLAELYSAPRTFREAFSPLSSGRIGWMT